MTQNKHLKGILLLAILSLFIGMFFALSLGAKEMELSTIIQSFTSFDGSLDHQLLRDVRLPRLLSTLLAGGILGICGTMMQGVTRNPIAEPSILGISQGATLAISILYLNAAWLSSGNILVASLIGALCSGCLIMLFTSRGPSNVSMSKLLLAGTALSTFFLSLSTLLNLLSNNSHLIGLLIGGGFRDASWNSVMILVVGTILGLVGSMFLAKKINLIALGDDVCIGLGQHPGRIRFVTLLLVIVCSAIAVAVGKNIAFVGLIIPQLAKHIVKQDLRYSIPVSFLFGSILLLYADLLARNLLAPYELPIGIFTSLLAIPFFLSIVRRERG